MSYQLSCRRGVFFRAGGRIAALAGGEQSERRLVRLAGVELVEGVLPEMIIRSGDRSEQREAGAEFKIVRRTEDGAGAFVFVRKDRRSAFAQAGTENRVGEVGTGLRRILQAVIGGVPAVAESAELRQNEPHPMRALLAGTKLRERIGIDGSLGIEKPGEIHCSLA